MNHLTFTLLLKTLFYFETLSHVYVYRIEYVSYRQRPYRIRIVSAADRIVPALQCFETCTGMLETLPMTMYQFVVGFMLPCPDSRCLCIQ